ncbi:hypothetical protein PAAG_12194 [Paracoccidioides lutzii Pb01]|uniref:Uncharacterized protein n=1 Tax=Paracoccidioides lutzii (strain ATCC MYA-826 / Pb01) TaxID=502779 RepID=A0A0A2V055_PARBA|nr:hypothetical protein PAAG_12194 [Paracoccidioides lutzii Pb01]KGQ01156.1 hypothetical protein PAAG_12194 [Paracoccidioides lutzii Pb01]
MDPAVLADEDPFGRPAILTILSRKATALQSLSQSIHILNLLSLRSVTHPSFTKFPDRGLAAGMVINAQTDNDPHIQYCQQLHPSHYSSKISTSCRSGVDEDANSKQPKSLKQEVQQSEKQAVKWLRSAFRSDSREKIEQTWRERSEMKGSWRQAVAMASEFCPGPLLSRVEFSAFSGTQMLHLARFSMSLRSHWQADRQLVRNVNPMASSSLRALVEVASGVRLTDQMLDAHCISAAHDRSFDLVYNNSQRFCSQVLQRLVYNRVITQSQFDELAMKGFQPLV